MARVLERCLRGGSGSGLTRWRERGTAGLRGHYGMDDLGQTRRLAPPPTITTAPLPRHFSSGYVMHGTQIGTLGRVAWAGRHDSLLGGTRWQTTTTGAQDPATAAATAASAPSSSAPVPPSGSGNASASTATSPPTTDASSVETAARLPGKLGEAGQPIYVRMEEAKGSGIWRFTKWLISTALMIFIFLTLASFFLEGSNLLKAGPGKVEHDPESQTRIFFKDVQGCDEAKEELSEIVEFLKDPTKFTKLGGKLPKGILLTGPPGTGKTLLARAVAGEAGVPFFFMSGAEFDEMFVGVGARRMRDLFTAAKKKSPAIIFIDEIDAVGSKRNPRDQAHHKQTLNELLVQLDGFATNQNTAIIVIASTNFPEVLDKALTRAGRFDRHVVVPLPDLRGRHQLLQHYIRESKSIPDMSTVDLSVIARGCIGFSGADIKNMVNEASILASRSGRSSVTANDLEFAKDKIMMGAERKSAYITAEAKKLTAYHEAGHALVALYTSGSMPLHKVTCIPRGRSLGMTTQLPEDDKHTYSLNELEAMVSVCFGGRVAEQLIFGERNVTTGAHNDIEKATNISRKIVTEFGMSEKAGPVFLDEEAMKNLSPSGRQVVEDEIKRLLEAGRDRAQQILTEKKYMLVQLAEALIERETMDAKQVSEVLGMPVDRVMPSTE